MWNLKKGRNKFLDRHRFDDAHSVWWYVARSLAANVSDDQRQAMEEELAAYELRLKDYLHWRPTASNCPVYAAIIEDVKLKLPPEWRALARNIFVGVILDWEINAEAWNQHDAGVIEVSLQYLWALEAYASAFDEFAFTLASRLNRVEEPHLVLARDDDHPDDYGNLRKIWQRLDEGAKGWRRQDAIEAGTDELVRARPGRQQRDFDRYQEVAQEFIVCHEIAHHVLTHTAHNARRREREARELVGPLFNALDKDALAQLSKASIQEIEADLVAIAIMMGHFEGGITRSGAYRAIGGAILALVTATHVNEHWLVYDPTDDHPPLAVRLWFVFSALAVWLKDLPSGDRGDHPLDYGLQWRVFVEALMTHWLEAQCVFVAEQNADLSDGEYTEGVAARFLVGWAAMHEPLPREPEQP